MSPATGRTESNLGVKNKFTNFAPRTGVSWRLDEKTVVRAGYGASTIPFPDNRYAFNFPVKQNNSGRRPMASSAPVPWRPAFRRRSS